MKCFYCDGGLREWRDGDDPWQEHAGWFPKVFLFCNFELCDEGFLLFWQEHAGWFPKVFFVVVILSLVMKVF